ncbi:MAG: hypothetical protein A3G32_09560 [Deltaproteobacteria bacterium RIFCSPLOWO2_12_FULL_40_28]|nr:MAG: hypothetical protein A3C45_07830 [Deltaproteobacteria bacterium RIFCSPHIGHO2_02_FULL_40_28]OGQ20527.1 MAG: hypothetical protein A3E27_02620 [Deltaproteobacteria bacterium RIFCSPHIGHO2_12_FULL_40_32]OGQ41178.1 MAG: hypothetical protein A3I69_07855 [Deltaproteobacteria bacterium RIFCSPLOWO2_02_FULL_40_36]OGQ55140.1 MAG: hypothetical protein A3G32_09560 [Deltaproteobacteria bacterium RIFCSPLOWO2_12_FULL_40_28]
MTRVSKQPLPIVSKADFENVPPSEGGSVASNITNQAPQDAFDLVAPHSNLLDSFLGQGGQGLAVSLGLNMAEVSDGETEETFDPETLALLDRHGALLEKAPSDSLAAGEADILIRDFLARQS